MLPVFHTSVIDVGPVGPVTTYISY